MRTKTLLILSVLILCFIGCDRAIESLTTRPPSDGSIHDDKTNRWNDRSFHDIIRAGGRHRSDRIKELIAEGGDLNELDHNGNTPAVLATGWGGQYDIAIMLVSAGAEYDIYKRNSNHRLAHFVVMEERRAGLWSPEQRRDHARLIKLLETRGESFTEVRADFARWKELYAGTSLSQYAKLRDQEIAEREARSTGNAGPTNKTSQSGSKITVQSPDALHQLIDQRAKGCDDCVQRIRELIAEGFDVNAISSWGMPAVIWAVDKGRQFDVALLLLQNGADPSVPCINQKTGNPLRLKLIHYVERAEDDIQMYDKQQRQGYEELVTWLTDHGESIEQAKQERHFWNQPLVEPPSADLNAD
ncbi:hypothetical protein [Rosistilla oblonga]|uniref:hypothetical protein n=1 Tax=Rosistilla oblonga TaxID=2527990 RepID=UPI003A970C7D